MMTMSTPSAVASPRATSWVPPRNHRVGDAAPAAVARQLPVPAASSSLRRPWRSASATVTSASSTPARTTASTIPWAVLPWPISSAAKVRVWVSTVPRYPSMIWTVHSRASTVAGRESSRSGGAHQYP